MSSTETVALWGAITGTAALALSLLQFLFVVRRQMFESPKLRIENVSAGQVFHGDLHVDSITAYLLNAGAFTLTVQSYCVEIYEERWRWLARRPTRTIRGDGNKTKLESGRAVGYLKPSDPDVVPFTIAAGSTARVDMNDKGLWPDRSWRRVVFVVRYAPPRSTSRRTIKVEPYNYSDEDSIKAAKAELLTAIARATHSNSTE